jgi:hypothetical protein
LPLKLLTVLVALAFASTAAGCGGSTPNNPRAVAEAFLKAFNRGDWGKACSLMTSNAKRSLAAIAGKVNCEDGLQAASDVLDAGDEARLKSARVLSVVVHGSVATVRYSTDKPGESARVVDKAGHWLMDEID